MIGLFSLRAQGRGKITYRHDLNEVLVRRGQPALPPALVELLFHATVKLDIPSKSWATSPALRRLGGSGLSSGAVVSPFGAVLTAAHGLTPPLNVMGFRANTSAEEAKIPGGKGYVARKSMDITDVATEEVGPWPHGHRPSWWQRKAVENRVRSDIGVARGQVVEALPDWLGRWTATIFDTFDVRLVYAAKNKKPDLALVRLYKGNEPAKTPHVFPWKPMDLLPWEHVVVAGYTRHHDEYLSEADLRRFVTLKNIFSKWVNGMKAYGHSGVPEDNLKEHPEIWHDPRWAVAQDYLGVAAHDPLKLRRGDQESYHERSTHLHEHDLIAAMVKMLLLYVPSMNEPDEVNLRVPRSAALWKRPSAEQQGVALHAIIKEMARDPTMGPLLIGKLDAEAIVSSYLNGSGENHKVGSAERDPWIEFLRRTNTVNRGFHKETEADGRWSKSQRPAVGEPRLVFATGLATSTLAEYVPQQFETTAPTASGMSGGPVVGILPNGKFFLQGVHNSRESEFDDRDLAGLAHLLGISNAWSANLPVNPADLGWPTGLVQEVLVGDGFH